MLTEYRPTTSQGATAVGKIIAKALLGLAIALWGAATVHAQFAATSVRTGMDHITINGKAASAGVVGSQIPQVKNGDMLTVKARFFAQVGSARIPLRRVRISFTLNVMGNVGLIQKTLTTDDAGVATVQLMYKHPGPLPVMGAAGTAFFEFSGSGIYRPATTRDSPVHLTVTAVAM